MKSEILDPAKRFSNRVENYIKFRPSYPIEILAFLKKEINLSSSFIIADIGSGTGILSKIFLENGNKVYCVEPNPGMRSAAEAQLKSYDNFISVNAFAENNSLKNQSIDLILAGQAFHWFDIEKSKKEFKRILKPNGFAALIWNTRKNDESEFLSSYEKLLLKYSIDCKNVDHKNVNEDVLKSFFNSYKKKVFFNSQKLDFNGLKGRLLSSSYSPTEKYPVFNSMMEELKRIFEANQKNGSVEFIYDTELFFGELY